MNLVKYLLIIIIGGFMLQMLFPQQVFARSYIECLNSYSNAVSQEAVKGCSCLSDAPPSEKDKYCSVSVAKPPGALGDIEAIISGAIKLIMIVAGLIAFVYLLLGGIKWITSGGDSGQVEAARNQIIQALVGLIIVFAAWGVIVLVEKMTGNCLGFTCPMEFPTFYTAP